jgi:hypothetical protein
MGQTRYVWLGLGVFVAMVLAAGMGTIAYAWVFSPTRGEIACAHIHALGDPEDVNGPLVSWARRLDKDATMDTRHRDSRSCEAPMDVLEDRLPADQFATVADCLAIANTAQIAGACVNADSF